MNNKINFGFSIDEQILNPEKFNTVEETIKYAQKSWDNKDGNPFDEDCDYSGTIFVCTVEDVIPSDVAPSIYDIAEQMTETFYAEYPIDDDASVYLSNKKEAEKAFEDFVNKYFELPCDYVSKTPIGEYDLIEHKWTKQHADFNKFVKY